jgi:hypothetical protein
MVMDAEYWSGDSSQWTQEKKLESLNPAFRETVRDVLDVLTGKGFEPRIVFGWRSVKTQLELFEQKKTEVRFSFHNAQRPDGAPNAYAVDVIDKRWAWGPQAEKNGFWIALGAAAEARSLVWGGRWKSLPDFAHIQCKRNDELDAVKKESGFDSGSL